MHALKEQPDVFVDALAADHQDRLLLCSAYGRDTSVQQLMARLHQGPREGGIDRLSIDAHPDRLPPMTVLVGDARRLDKVTGRLPRTRLLGNLVHCWIFDPVLREVDHANRCAWIARHDAGGDAGARRSSDLRLSDQAWSLVCELSPVPLLPAWRSAVLDHLERHAAFRTPPTLGPLSLLRIELPEDFPTWMSEQVRCGALAA